MNYSHISRVIIRRHCTAPLPLYRTSDPGRFPRISGLRKSYRFSVTGSAGGVKYWTTPCRSDFSLTHHPGKMEKRKENASVIEGNGTANESVSGDKGITNESVSGDNRMTNESVSDDNGMTNVCLQNDRNFQSLFSPGVLQIQSLFEKCNYEIRFAGGPVRDLLRGIRPSDIDFATTATPDEMLKMFGGADVRTINKNGLGHGTVTARIDDENFEVTTLRIDVVTHGRRAEVKFTKDWKLDAFRRDLTINSMYLDFKGNLYDFFDGKQDLEANRITFVGDADTRIQEDYLRILRYFRFYGRISSKPAAHSETTLKAIESNATGLKGVSGERLFMELRKILVGNHCPALISAMNNVGVLQYLGLDNVDERKLFRLETIYNKCHHLDPNPVTILTGLIDNIEELAIVDRRLRMSRLENCLSKYLMATRDSTIDLETLQDEIVDARNNTKQALTLCKELAKCRGDGDLLSQISDWMPPKFPLGGNDLMALGLVSDVKQLGQLLDRLRVVWKKTRFTMDKQQLLECATSSAGLAP